MIKKIILLLPFLLLFPVPSWATFSNAQVPVTVNCPLGTTCTIATSATGTGNLGVIMVAADSFLTVTISGVSGAGSWTAPAGAVQFSSGAGETVMAAYTLATTPGATSVVVTFSANVAAELTFYEVQFTGTSIALDSGASGGVGVVNNTSSSSVPPGVALTLAGSNDAIFQGIGVGAGAPTSISAYTLDTGANFGGSAHLYNTSSGTAPTWTNSSSAASAGNALAFTEGASVSGMIKRTATGGVF